MAFTKENRPHVIYGLLFVSLFAAAATMIADTPPALSLHISPLVLGLVIGMFYANALSGHLPKEWGLGIAFASSPLS